MEARDPVGGEQVGVMTPPVPGADEPAVVDLLHEYSDVFAEPEFPPADRVTHDIPLIDETT